MSVSFSPLFLIFCVLCLSCNDVRIEKAPNTAAQEDELTDAPVIKIARFDQALFNIDPNEVEKGLVEVRKQWPDFTEFFLGPGFMHISDPREKSTINEASLRGFLTHAPTRALYDTVQLVFKDLTPLENQLGQMIGRWKKLVPGTKTPQLVGVVSEFSTAAFTYGDSLLVFSMEFFLGPNDPHYQLLEDKIPQYIGRTLDKTHLPVYLAEALIHERFGDSPEHNMLGQMIWNGKCQYLINQMLPNLPDSVRFKFTGEQMKWCFDNEAQIWSFFGEKEMLYSTDQKLYKKYVEDSPTSPGMPPQSPGRTGNFIGWRIVQQYMDKHPNTTVEQLFALQDPQALMQAAAYKPAR